MIAAKREREAKGGRYKTGNPAHGRLTHFWAAFILGILLVGLIMVLMFATTTSTMDRVSMSEEVFLIEEETGSLSGAAENVAISERETTAGMGWIILC